MKKLVALVFSLFVVFAATAQEEGAMEDDQSGPKITFSEEKFDFGDITQGDKVEHVFEFENTGNEPLIITNVQTTCGCTAPEWPRDPVLPGQKNKLKVVFNSAGKSGKQNKVVTIISNATGSLNRVTITTNVLPKEADDTL